MPNLSITTTPTVATVLECLGKLGIISKLFNAPSIRNNLKQPSFLILLQGSISAENEQHFKEMLQGTKRLFWKQNRCIVRDVISCTWLVDTNIIGCKLS